MDLPLPPSIFVVAPTRRTREQRKVDKKKQRSEGPKIQESKEDSTQKMIHKLHLKEQEIQSTSVLYLCSGWVDEGPARKKM